MERCRCGREQRWGEVWCPACGQRFGAGVAGLGPGVPVPPKRPGTVTAAQVVLGVGAAGNALLALISLVVLVTTLGRGSSSAELGELAAGVVLVAYCLGAGAFDVWAAVAVGTGNRLARLLVTVVAAAAIPVDILLFALLDVVPGQTALTVVLSVPHAAALAILLWTPEPSRRHFGDTVAPQPAPMRMPTSGPVPMAVPTPARVPAPTLGADAVLDDDGGADAVTRAGRPRRRHRHAARHGPDDAVERPPPRRRRRLRAVPDSATDRAADRPSAPTTNGGRVGAAR